jgi:hypothetical protein
MARITQFGVGVALAALASLTATTPSLSQNRAPGELRCGWMHNPTPGNHWLTDRDGTWTMSTQSRRSVPGMDRLPDMTTNGWVETNGYYGYGCACIRMTVNRQTGNVIRIYSGRPVPLNQCRNDRSLPRP